MCYSPVWRRKYFFANVDFNVISLLSNFVLLVLLHQNTIFKEGIYIL